MLLVEGGRTVQSLDLSRHASYVLGRSAASAKLVVPHESVSRQHAALFHANQGPGGAPTVHVVDLASAMGTFLDVGTGWSRLEPNSPALLSPGGRVRLGDCPTRIVYPPPEASGAPAAPVAPVTDAAATSSSATPAPAGPSIGPAAGPKAAAEAEDDGTPRFSSLLSSTLLRATDVADTGRAGGAGNGETEGEDDDGGEGGGGGGGGGDADVVGGESARPLNNSDFRDALLPFLSKSAAVRDESAGGKRRDGGKPKRRRDDDSDDDAEPPPPLSLSKSDAAAAAAPGGLVLRKTKGVDKKRSKSGSSSTKIKF
jgi:hypothetical protein